MKRARVAMCGAACLFCFGCMGPTVFAHRSVVNYTQQEATMEGAITNRPSNTSSVEADKQYETASSVNTSTGTATATQKHDGESIAK